MSKKEKPISELEDNFQAVLATVHRLEAFIKAHKEIAAGYKKFRKNGGKAITGIEKHLGIKEQKSPSSEKKKKAAIAPEADTSEEVIEIKKAHKKTIK